MKDLGAAKQILGMRITRNNGMLRLSQEEYVKKVLSSFSMSEAKLVSTPLATHFKLSKEQSPTTEEERDHMAKVPYAFAIGSLMYVMVCTKLDIVHTVGVMSRYMSNPEKQHWEAKRYYQFSLVFQAARLSLQGQVDADMARGINGKKSTIEYVYTL